MANDVPHRLAARRADGTAIFFGTAGLLMLGLQPILLEQLILAGRTTLDGAGLLAMAEIVAIGVGAAVANVVLPVRRLRTTAALAVLLLALANWLTPFAVGGASLAAVRVLAGLSGGVLVWLATQAIVRFPAPERLAALFLLLQSCGQAAAAFSLGEWAIPKAGLQGGFIGLALLSLLPLLFVRWLPSELAAHTEAAQKLPPLQRSTVASALCIAFAMAVVGALWTFLETLGRESELAARPVHWTITGVLVAQLLGAGIASWLAPRLNARRALAGCNFALLLIAAAYLLLPRANLTWFVLTSAAFGFLWLYMMPLHVKLAFQADAEGRLAVQVPALQLLGSALGPMTAALFVAGDAHVRPAFVTGAVYALLALLAVAVAGTARAASPR